MFNGNVLFECGAICLVMMEYIFLVEVVCQLLVIIGSVVVEMVAGLFPDGTSGCGAEYVWRLW